MAEDAYEPSQRLESTSNSNLQNDDLAVTALDRNAFGVVLFLLWIARLLNPNIPLHYSVDINLPDSTNISGEYRPLDDSESDSD